MKKNQQNPSKRGPYKKSEFEIYASFLALPRNERKEIFGFHTDQGFSKRYKINRQTLSEWKKDENLWKLRDKFLIHFKKYTADILQSLYQGALKKKQAAEAIAWMKIVEKFSEKTETEISGEFPITIIIKKGDPTKQKEN